MAAAADLARVLEDLSDPAKLAKVLEKEVALQEVAQRDPEVARLLTEDLTPVAKIFAQMHAALEQGLQEWRAHPEDAERAAQRINSVLRALQPLVDAPLPVGAFLASGGPRMAARAASAPTAARPSARPVMETKGDLEVLAKKLNPVVGYWEPLNLVEYDQWGAGEEGTIGWLRQSEIKHGRVAMAAFVGYVLQSNNVHFPGNIANGISYQSIYDAGNPMDQWDAMPTWGKVQIIVFVGLLELFSESEYILKQSNMKHYMAGGKPGAYPSIKDVRPAIPHPLPFDLYDPLDLSKGFSAEKKEKGLLAELNNGRLAMIGIMAFIAEAKIPGSVPLLDGIIPGYKGAAMGLPFSPFLSTDETRDLVMR